MLNALLGRLRQTQGGAKQELKVEKTWRGIREEARRKRDWSKSGKGPGASSRVDYLHPVVSWGMEGFYQGA